MTPVSRGGCGKRWVSRSVAALIVALAVWTLPAHGASIAERLHELQTRYAALKAEGRDVSTLEPILDELNEAIETKDVDKAYELVDRGLRALAELDPEFARLAAVLGRKATVEQLLEEVEAAGKRLLALPGGDRVASEVAALIAASKRVPFLFPAHLAARHMLSAEDGLEKGSLSLCLTILNDGLGSLAWAESSAAAWETGREKAVIYLIPGVHVDMGWNYSSPRAEEQQCTALATALDIMERAPEYRFTLEATYVLKRFLQEHPERMDDVRKRLRDGKLEVAASWVLPHAMGFCGEASLRQISYAKRWLRRHVSYDSRLVQYHDSPVFIAQSPQIMSGCDIDVFVCTTGGAPGGADVPLGAFWWEGPGSAKVLTLRAPNYGVGLLALVDGGAEYGESLCRGFAWPGCGMFWPTEVDNLVIPSQIVQRQRQWNSSASAVKMRFATVAEYLRQTDTGEIARTFSGPVRLHRYVRAGGVSSWGGGGFGTVPDRLAAHCKLAPMLVDAQNFATLHGLLCGAPFPAGEFDAVWERLLYDHDPHFCAQSPEKRPDVELESEHATHRVKLLREAIDRGVALSDDVYSALASDIALPTTPDAADNAGAAPVVVFNPTPWERTEVVTVAAGAEPVAVLDHLGERVELEADGDSVSFIAHVPPLGWSSYSVVLGTQAPEGAVVSPSDADTIRNRRYRIRVDRRRGVIESVYDRQLRRELFTPERRPTPPAIQIYRVAPFPPANPFELLALRITDRQHITPESVEFSRAREWGADVRVITGPLSERIIIEGRKDGLRFKQTLRLWKAGADRLEIEVSAETPPGGEHGVAMALPFNASSPTLRVGVPFGSEETEMLTVLSPVHNWIAAGDDGATVTLCSDWPMFRSAGSVVYADLSANRAGREWEYGEFPKVRRFAVTSGAADWRSVNSPRLGEELAHPLIAVRAAPHRGGVLPPTYSFATASRNLGGLVLAPAEESGAVLARFYEALDRQGTAALNLALPEGKAELTNLVGDTTGPLDSLADIPVTGHQIVSVRVAPAR